MVVTSFAIGVLGKSIFYLGFVDAILVVFFFNILGVTTVCFFSCFGATFGLRQMVLSRFWFGWWGVKLSQCWSNLQVKRVLLTKLLQLPFSMCWPVSAGRQQT